MPSSSKGKGKDHLSARNPTFDDETIRSWRKENHPPFLGKGKKVKANGAKKKKGVMSPFTGGGQKGITKFTNERTPPLQGRGGMGNITFERGNLRFSKPQILEEGGRESVVCRTERKTQALLRGGGARRELKEGKTRGLLRGRSFLPQ